MSGRSLIVCGMLALMALACSSAKPGASAQERTPAAKKSVPAVERAILIGEAGGRTGKTQQYLLRENGVVEFQAFTTQALAAHKTLKAPEVAALFARAEGLQLTTRKTGNPGLMMRFLEWRVANHYHRIAWDSAAPHDPDVAALYETVLEAVR